MPSFEIIYEEEEDVLEVTFEVFEEHFARALPLNDSILLHTDLNLSTVWGLTFYNYTQLLQISETHLTGMDQLPEAEWRKLLALLRRPPTSHFLEILDTLESEGSRALVKVASLRSLLPI